MKKDETTSVAKIFGAVLRKHREMAEISQEELADRAGVDRTFISRLERGVRQPTITTILGVGAALAIPAALLVEELEARLSLSETAKRKKVITRN